MAKVELFNLGSVKEEEYTRIVCVTRYNGKWVYSRMKGKDTWEIPGGHIEYGENWQTAVKRELFEEAGVIKAKIEPICVYKISKYALLCFAEVLEMTDLPNYEMDEIGFFDDEPLDTTDTSNCLFFPYSKISSKSGLVNGSPPPKHMKNVPNSLI